jgi:hypothetical protein
MSRAFSENQLHQMNYSSDWRNTIQVVPPKLKNKNTSYNLHATGKATLNGREYVAIPVNVSLTSDIKLKYNIW